VTGGLADPMLTLLEFTSRAALGDSQLWEFTSAAIASNSLTLKSLEIMAAVALANNSKAVAGLLLEKLVALALTLPMEQRRGLPIYLRETILLGERDNETLAAFEKAVAILASGAAEFPAEEVQWLVSFSWNSGIRNHRTGNISLAEKWTAKSLGLLSACPQLQSREKQMRSFYDKVLHARR
jgi:hypothetical protein